MTRGARTWILLIVLAVCVGTWLIAQNPAPMPTAQASNPQQAVPAVRKYPTPGPPYPKAQNWTLTVGPNACTVQQNGKPVPVAVILRGAHSITYKSDKGEPLGVRFHAPWDAPTAAAPFKNMTFAGKDEDGSYMWSLGCNPYNQCRTGPAIAGSKGGYWKTDQILPGQQWCDAGIIIQP